MDMSVMIIFVLVIMLLSLTSIILIAAWVYRDAKSRGLEAWVWTLVTLLVPSFIGLLLYFLVGRKESRRICQSCGKQVSARSTFCGYCGAQMPQELPAQPQKGAGKGLLVAGIAGIVVTLVLGFGSIVLLVLSDEVFDDRDMFRVSTIYVENNIGNRWNVKYHYTNTTPDHSFKIRDDGPYTLYYEGECEEGSLLLHVWQGDVKRTVDLSGGDEVEGSLDLSIFAPGKVWMELDNDNGAGTKVEFEARWE